MGFAARLLTNRNFIFLSAIALGLLIYPLANLTKHLTLPALALAMTASLLGIPTKTLTSNRSLLMPFFVGVGMNYLVLTNFIIFAGAVFVEGERLWQGVVLMAAVPPAIAIIPFAHILKGNGTYALIGVVGGYLGALILMPVIIYVLLDGVQVAMADLLIVALQLIVLPLVLSRLLIRKGWDRRLEPVKGAIIDWSFFLVLFSVIGVNRQLLFAFPLNILPVAAITFASTFMMGLVIEWTGRLFRIEKGIVVSVMLLGTLKNYGLAGGLALNLFAGEAALPAALGSIFLIFYILWLDFKKRKL